MWMTLQRATPAPVVAELKNVTAVEVSTAQVRGTWDSEMDNGRESEWTTRPRGEQWLGIADPINMEGPQQVAVFPRAGGEIMHQLHPPEERKQEFAIRNYPRFYMKGDLARKDKRRPDLEFQTYMPDWSDAGNGGREMRDHVTNVSTPNPGGHNSDWAGLMTDPQNQFLRDPAIGDWWTA